MDRFSPNATGAAWGDEAHGGRLQEARQLFPGAPEPFLDLSTGINPVAYPIPPLTEAAWTRLPEPEAIAGLEAVAAEAYGVSDAALVVASPGTQILISLIPRLIPQASVAILGPTYGEYARAFAAVGSRVSVVDTVAELKGASCAVLCNPNNPDGRRIDAATLVAWLRENSATLVMVDEAFADFEDRAFSLAPYLPEPGLCVLRSLSKAYGLAGLRLGFALTSPDLAASIRGALGPWPVSGLAIEIGRRALADRPWLEAAKRRLAEDVKRLDAMLREAGLAIKGGTLLFRLAASASALRLFHRLGEAGILVRRFEDHPHWLRFGIPGSEAEWTRLAAALA
jgi:cobalamin biosynthesis protein CobC